MQPLNAQEKTKEYSPAREWVLLISTSRKNPKPYNVTSMHYDDFYNFQVLEQDMVKNKN